jgi:hypothetical protein
MQSVVGKGFSVEDALGELFSSGQRRDSDLMHGT